MSAPAIEVNRVWKKFHRGEMHDSLRDFIPALARSLLGKGTKRTTLGKDDFWALAEVDFQVRPGEALGIIGPNGAGKSTLLKILSRILRPTRGKYHVHGRLRALIEVAAGFHDDLTGLENIYLNGAILGMRRREIDRRRDEIISFSGIEAFIDTPAKRYSSGMRARLGFAIAAHMDPEVLLIDEVLSVGDVGFQAKCLAHMRKIRTSGVAMIFVSHDIHQVCQLCDAVLVLDRGRTAHYGGSDEAAKVYLDLVAGRAQGASRDDESTTLRVRPADDAGNPVSALPFGDGFALRADLHFPTPIEDCVLILKIATAEGHEVLTLSSQRQGLTVPSGRSTFVCRASGVRLLPNTYKLRAMIQDRQSDRVLERFIHQQPLTILPPETDLGLPPGAGAVFDVHQQWECRVG